MTSYDAVNTNIGAARVAFDVALKEIGAAYNATMIGPRAAYDAAKAANKAEAKAAYNEAVTKARSEMEGNKT